MINVSAFLSLYMFVINKANSLPSICEMSIISVALCTWHNYVYKLGILLLHSNLPDLCLHPWLCFAIFIKNSDYTNENMTLFPQLTVPLWTHMIHHHSLWVHYYVFLSTWCNIWIFMSARNYSNWLYK